MLPLLLSVVVLVAPFEAEAVRAGTSEPVAFLLRLCDLGSVRRREVHADFAPTRVTWSVRLRRVVTIAGVACEGQVFAWGDGVENRGRLPTHWGCRLARKSALAWRLPVGTVATFSMTRGVLEALSVPPGAHVLLNDVACGGDLSFSDGVLTRCELARPQRLHDLELPAGAVLSFSRQGVVTTAALRGVTVTVAGREWGPEYTPCGWLELSFAPDGGLVPPQPDREACCD